MFAAFTGLKILYALFFKGIWDFLFLLFVLCAGLMVYDVTIELCGWADNSVLDLLRVPGIVGTDAVVKMTNQIGKFAGYIVVAVVNGFAHGLEYMRETKRYR